MLGVWGLVDLSEGRHSRLCPLGNRSQLSNSPTASPHEPRWLLSRTLPVTPQATGRRKTDMRIPYPYNRLPDTLPIIN